MTFEEAAEKIRSQAPSAEIIPFPRPPAPPASDSRAPLARNPSLSELFHRSLALRQHDMTIRNGLRICVSYEVFDAEPDVGLTRPYPEIAEIRTYDAKGRSWLARWLEVQLTDAEWDEIKEALPV